MPEFTQVPLSAFRGAAGLVETSDSLARYALLDPCLKPSFVVLMPKPWRRRDSASPPAQRLTLAPIREALHHSSRLLKRTYDPHSARVCVVACATPAPAGVAEEASLPAISAVPASPGARASAAAVAAAEASDSGDAGTADPRSRLLVAAGSRAGVVGAKPACCASQ